MILCSDEEYYHGCKLQLTVRISATRLAISSSDCLDINARRSEVESEEREAVAVSRAEVKSPIRGVTVSSVAVPAVTKASAEKVSLVSKKQTPMKVAYQFEEGSCRWSP